MPSEEVSMGSYPADGGQAQLGWLQRLFQRIGRSLRLTLRMGKRNLERLRAEIAVTRESIDQLFAEEDHDAVGKLLNRAAAAASESDLEAGWKSLNAALALRFNSMGESERTGAAETIRVEIRKKDADSWRAQAIDAILTPGEGSAAPSASALREAQALLSEYSANVYRRLDAFAVTLAWTTVILAAVVVLFVLGVGSGWFVDLEAPFDSVESTMGVLLLGSLGALVSTVTASVFRSEAKRIPEMSSGFAIALTRPVLGAASAVVVVLVLVSGIQDTVSTSGARVWVYAIAAGFTERLLTRLLSSVESAVAG